MAFRFHLDIALGDNKEEAIGKAKRIVDILRLCRCDSNMDDIVEHTDVQYRLGCDEDRQKSNYLDINENGHVSTRKLKL